MMLFGCSSAAMTLGKSEPNGFSHSNLINSSPGVLGCLWEVTDKDTDKVTESIFKNLSSQPQNL
jgi:separase